MISTFAKFSLTPVFLTVLTAASWVFAAVEIITVSTTQKSRKSLVYWVWMNLNSRNSKRIPPSQSASDRITRKASGWG